MQHAVEDDLAVLVFIESEIPEVVQHSSGLRHGEGVNPGHISSEWILRPGIVCHRVTEKRIEIAHGSEADPIDCRIFRGVGKFIDIVGDEGCSGGKKSDRVAAVCVPPIRCRNNLRLVIQMNAMGQGSLRLVERGCGIVQRVRRAGTDNVFVRGADDGRAIRIFCDWQRNRQIEIGIIRASGKVPAAPDHGVALPCQKCATGIARSRRVIAARGPVEAAKCLAATVRRFVEDLVVSLAEVGRLQDVEVE